jgi:RHS repeat-associated protein
MMLLGSARRPRQRRPPVGLPVGGGWGYQKEYADGSDPGIGLTYIQNRYYDSHAGRFMSLDPIRFAGGLNLYEYAGGNPIGMVDPDGRRPTGTGVLRALKKPIARAGAAGAVILVTGTGGRNWWFTRQLFMHSLQDNPQNLTFREGSPQSQLIRAAPEYLSALDRIDERHGCSQSFAGTETVFFRGADLRGSIQRAFVDYSGEYVGGQHRLDVTVRDIYNFEWQSNYGGYGGWRSWLWVSAGNAGWMGERTGLLQPYEVRIDLEEFRTR